jgi:hypothetical protein
MRWFLAAVYTNKPGALPLMVDVVAEATKVVVREARYNEESSTD